MKRRLFTILSALSLVLCIATAILWVRSIWVADFLTHNSTDFRSNVGLTSARARLSLGVSHFQQAPEILISSGWQTFQPRQIAFPASDPGWKFLGFAVAVDTNGTDQHIGITVPHWFAVGVSAVLPIGWVRKLRRLRLASCRGLCPTCGYDLRASKERCPECGTPISVQTGGSTGGG